tara:strand:+ start:195 stop:617 length:423 start_codon:yes stop_codon:yes gene_type:complete
VILASLLGALQVFVLGPNLREARIHGLESGAIRSLRRLSLVQSLYRERHPEVRYGSVSELIQAGLLTPAEAQPEGYQLELRRGPDPHFCWAAIATPHTGSLARRHFATDVSGVIHYREQPYVFRPEGSLDLPLRPLTPDG